MLRKRIALLERRDDLSFEEFDEHWATPHAEIISRLPGLQEYVQNSVLDWWRSGDASGVDGIVEVWFDDGVVTSPEQHTSMTQQDDEVRFIRTLTAVTVTDRRSYSSDDKVWILAPASLTGIPGLPLPDDAIVCSPEPDAVLMERPRLRRDAAAPSTVIILPVARAQAVALFDAVVAAFTESGAPDGLRVLRTTTRRIR
ncbi:EthD domain-containing protein [Salinibacterium sp. ZJ450]|uniref:EthD domain-containing protein n=1 Tax=Salinibacterium sp. ZJ450 TaxID=2708338 RepID=UPI00141F1B33|nr:EthD domain-containing protein [Salinibacterium sp. ZJ450]